MTAIEREQKLKEVIPAAVAAITDLLNVWAEIAEFEGEDGVTFLDAEKALSSMKVMEERFHQTIQLCQMAGLYYADELPGVISFVRQAIQNSFDAPSGTISKRG